MSLQQERETEELLEKEKGAEDICRQKEKVPED